MPVNPSASAIFDVPCYPNLQAYGQGVELAIIAVPKEKILDAVNDCLKADVKAIIIVTSGFRELNEEGHLLEQEIVRMCARNGVRVLGPNCLGLINTANRMNASVRRCLISRQAVIWE